MRIEGVIGMEDEEALHLVAELMERAIQKKSNAATNGATATL